MLEGTLSVVRLPYSGTNNRRHITDRAHVFIRLCLMEPFLLFFWHTTERTLTRGHTMHEKPLHIVMLEGTFLLHSSRTHTSQPMQQQHSTALYTLCMGPMSYQIGCKPCDGPEPSSVYEGKQIFHKPRDTSSPDAGTFGTRRPHSTCQHFLQLFRRC